MEQYLTIFFNNLSPFFANIGLLILTAWVISHFYQKNNRSIRNINLLDKVKVGVLFGFITFLLISSPVKLESGIIMDTRGIPLLVSGMLGGPISGVISMICGLYVRYSFGGAGMIGGLIYIIIFSSAGILWHLINKNKNFPNPSKLVYITVAITTLTVPVILTLPENKQLWALITIWPLMYIANSFGAYIIGNVITSKIADIELLYNQKQTISHQKNELSKKDIQLLEQSKMIALSELLWNLAHQWRQPLNAISTVSSALKLKCELNKEIAKNELIYTHKTIEEQVQYLSDTIETFIKYTKKDKEYKEISLQKEIRQSKEIIIASLTNNGIELVDKIDYNFNNTIKGIKGEISQIVTSILKNAQDIISQKGIEKGQIIIDLIKKEKDIVISIEDNGGGISKDIINKVFEPYFTTKHQYQGIGLSLHLSYQIITQNYNGKIWVENVNKGAKFFIKIPIS